MSETELKWVKKKQNVFRFAIVIRIEIWKYVMATYLIY